MDYKEVKEAIAALKLESKDVDVEAKELICIKDDHCFVWDRNKCVVLCISLSKYLPSDESRIQVFRPNNCPMFDVERLLVSERGMWICLHGRKGVSCLELPRKSGKFGRFLNGKREIACKIVPLCEETLSRNHRLLVQHVKFHPGSLEETCIVLLTSDNRFWFFNLDLGDRPLLHMELKLKANEPNSTQTANDTTNLHGYLGETAVCFDFAPSMKDNESEIWPIFILFENGDVYCYWTSLHNRVLNKLTGPIPMYPESTDNYGCESCSIICLHPVTPSPPVLVIANNSGTLYHCVVLSRQEDLDGISQESEWSAMSTLEGEELNLSLHVFEAVELDIGMLNNPDISSDRLFDHPLILDVDPSTAARYFCSHKAGVHCVALPVMCELAKLAQMPESKIFDILESESIVEHLICTQMSEASKPHPILGISIYSPPTSLFCLLNDCRMEEVKISGLYFDLPTPDTLAIQGDYKSNSSNPESFEQKIRSLLRKDVNLPLIKASGSTPSTKECLDVITKCTKTLREEYISRLSTVQTELEKRSTQLQSLQASQLKSLGAMTSSKNSLREKAAELAERYEDLKDNSDSQRLRIEVILQKLNNSVSELSDAELKMLRQLKGYEKKSKDYLNAFDQIRSKQKYQKQQMDIVAKSRKLQIQGLDQLDENQLASIKEVLKGDSEEISAVVQKITSTKRDLGSALM